MLESNCPSEEEQEITYLDWAATAPLNEYAVSKMKHFLTEGVQGLKYANANANSLYKVGRNAFRELESSRKEVAEAIGAKRPYEVIFTSGATEANNAALFGMVDALMLKAEHEGNHECVPEVVISSIEHDSILEAAHVLYSWGAQIVMVEPDKTGHITPEALEAVMTEHTILVSIMAVNNEIGSVMDVPSLCEVAHKHGALFHTDATQAFGKIPFSVSEWGIDALSISSHKIGGPKGVGALYLKERTPFSPQIVGGGQESNKRSGTQNVMGASAFACVCKHANLLSESNRLIELRDYCYAELIKTNAAEPVVEVCPGSTEFAPHIVSVLVPGHESESLILEFDKRGICVSGGSACSSHSLDPSHVLKALSIERSKALCALRVSIGETTTKQDIDTFLNAFREIVAD